MVLTVRGLQIIVSLVMLVLLVRSAISLDVVVNAVRPDLTNESVMNWTNTNFVPYENWSKNVNGSVWNITAKYYFGNATFLTNLPNGTGVYVPYSGATGNVDLGDKSFTAGSGTFEKISFSGGYGEPVYINNDGNDNMNFFADNGNYIFPLGSTIQITNLEDTVGSGLISGFHDVNVQTGTFVKVNITGNLDVKNITVGTPAEDSRIKISATDGAKGVYGSGILVVNNDSGFASMQGPSSLEGLGANTSGDIVGYGDFWIQYWSAGDLSLNTGFGKTYLGAGTAYLSESGTNVLVVGNNLYVADTTDLGSELVTNGGFTTDTGWTKGTGWTIAGGVGKHEIAGTGTLQPAVSLAPTAGNFYLVSVTLSNITAGGLKFTFGGRAIHPVGTNDINTPGTRTYIIRASSNANLIFTSSATTARLDIDDVSVKQITGGDLQVLGNLVVNGNSTLGSMTFNGNLNMSNANITNVNTLFVKNITGVGCINFSDNTWLCTAYNVDSNLTQLWGNITDLKSNDSTQANYIVWLQGNVSYLNTNASDQYTLLLWHNNNITALWTNASQQGTLINLVNTTAFGTFLNKDGTTALTGDWTAGANRIINLYGGPVDATAPGKIRLSKTNIVGSLGFTELTIINLTFQVTNFTIASDDGKGYVLMNGTGVTNVNAATLNGLTAANINDSAVLASQLRADWTTHDNYPTACGGAGQANTAVQTIGDTLTCIDLINRTTYFDGQKNWSAFTTNIIPDMKEGYILGSPLYKWNNIYAVNFTGTFIGTLIGNANSSTFSENATFANLAGNSLTFDGESDFGALGQNINNAGYNVTTTAVLSNTATGNWTIISGLNGRLRLTSGGSTSHIFELFPSVIGTDRPVDLTFYYNGSATSDNRLYWRATQTGMDYIGTLASQKVIYPHTDNAYSLGTASYRWANVYAGSYRSDTTPAGIDIQTYSGISWAFLNASGYGVYGVAFGGNISRIVGITQGAMDADKGLRLYSPNAGEQAFVPNTDNAYKLGTVNNRWSDLRSVLINGADYCFQNNLCLTECVINGVQDICVVEGLPTREQAEIMGLADVKDYAEYKVRMNGSLMESQFNIQKSKAFKGNIRDFVFDRKIITSLGKISDLEQRISVLEERIK